MAPVLAKRFQLEKCLASTCRHLYQIWGVWVIGLCMLNDLMRKVLPKSKIWESLKRNDLFYKEISW